MRVIRNRARMVATAALVWHLVAIGAVPTVLACDPGRDTPVAHDSTMTHEGMSDCPMQRHERPACPKHGAGHGSHECDCPTLDCSTTDTGFMAVFGSVAILPSPALVFIPLPSGQAVCQAAVEPDRLAPVPPSPPPRT